jgi:hypothetical protein
LRSLHRAAPLPPGTTPGSLESWQTAIAQYCGIPQPELAAQHAYEVLARLNKGYDDHGIHIASRALDMATVRANASKIYAEVAAFHPLQKSVGQPDYPQAHWAQAYPGHWYTSGIAKDFVVIHDMEGYYLSVISYFQMSTTNASVHYDVNGMQDSPSDAPAGDITQQVEEQYWAWHAVCLNRYSLGIEHEGFVSNPAWWTPEMYIASANLVRHMCDKFGIPKDRNHIIGHNEYQNSEWVSWAVANGYPAEFGTCNNHTDPGTNWDWAFFMQLIKQDPIPPRVSSMPPAGRIAVFQPLTVTFDQRMDRVATEQSFRITPNIPGTLSWSAKYRTLEFAPSSPLLFDTEYTVTIDTGAQNYLGAGLDVNGDGVGKEVYTYTVRTVVRDTVPPVLSRTYPATDQAGLSPTLLFEVDLSEPVDPTTLTGAFELRASNGTAVTLTSPAVQPAGSGVRVTFRPQMELQASAPYTLTVLPSVADYGGNGLGSAWTVPFTTGPVRGFAGTVINRLDDVGSWWQPGTSGSTTGTTTTSFSIATDVKRSGSGSGKVSYQFSGPAGGRVREYNSGKPSVDPGPVVAAWVFGDNSGNALEYWFYPGAAGSSFTGIRVDTLNWTGWKLVATSISGVPTTAQRQFAGFVISQVAGARTAGTVYFDDLSTGQGVTSAESPASDRPERYALFQNYPNPFNPATTIEYAVAGSPGSAPELVRLAVYDLLGQEVVVLVNERKDAGRYAVPWDASGLPSGVYICRMTAGAFSSSAKMVLMK